MAPPGGTATGDRSRWSHLLPSRRARAVARRCLRWRSARRTSLFDPVDLPVLLEHFAAATRPVSFVQVGSNDGVSGDPIHPFIVRDGWRGVLVEPVRYLFDRLVKNYAGCPGVALENVAIGDQPGHRPLFHLRPAPERCLPFWHEQLGSFDRDLVVRNASAIPGLAPDVVDEMVIAEEVECVPLAALLERQRLDRLDLLHLDTEGYDYEILRRLDFRRLRPRLILFEHRHLGAERKPCIRFLEGHGYQVLMWKNDAAALDGRVVSTQPLGVRWRRRRGRPVRGPRDAAGATAG